MKSISWSKPSRRKEFRQLCKPCLLWRKGTIWRNSSVLTLLKLENRFWINKWSLRGPIRLSLRKSKRFSRKRIFQIIKLWKLFTKLWRKLSKSGMFRPQFSKLLCLLAFWTSFSVSCPKWEKFKTQKMCLRWFSTYFANSNHKSSHIWAQDSLKSAHTSTLSLTRTNFALSNSIQTFSKSKLLWNTYKKV